MEGRRSQASLKRKNTDIDTITPGTPVTKTKAKALKRKPVRPKPQKAGSSGTAKRVYVREVELDGEVFRVGDQVYVVINEELLREGLEDEETDASYSCGVCGSCSHKKSPLLECSRCLGGFHLSCLDPPLEAVPDGDWVCPECSMGRERPARAVTCARERLLQQRGLALARIVSMWLDTATGWHEFTAQWYFVPEETHVGRQNHHVAREVFLSQLHDHASVESILRHATVIQLADYNACGEIGDDVFVCDYEYDCVWQRFRRHAWDALEEVSDSWDDAEHGGLSDDEDHDASFTIADAMDEEGLLPKGKGVGKGRRKRQGGQDFQAQLGTRTIPEHVRRATPPAVLAQARNALTLASAPTSLPCRENEHQAVESFVEEVLSNGDGGKGRCLYISGIPGTGKTATVLQVMRTLRERAQAGEIPQFQFVDINGLRLPSPQHAYSALYEALTGESVGVNTAPAALEELFSNGKAKRRSGHHHTIVLLDELDSLINRTQTVLYNLFDWPSRAGSRLSIIGIANTMDLPERLHPRIGSRLAGCRLVFHPYQRDQLETIMRSRLGDSAFEANAVTLCARKVANCSGDVRRCLELCRRAAEIAARRHTLAGGEGTLTVLMRDVDTAFREAFNSPHTTMVRESSKLERLLLAAIHLESRNTGRCEVSLENVASRLAVMHGAGKPPRFMSVLQCAVSLAARKVILCDGGHRRLKVNVALNVPNDDLIFVLSDDAELAWLKDQLK